MKKFLEERRMEGEYESGLECVKEERIGGETTLRTESEKELFNEMLTFT